MFLTTEKYAPKRDAVYKTPAIICLEKACVMSVLHSTRVTVLPTQMWRLDKADPFISKIF
jgi:hypothetical protein